MRSIRPLAIALAVVLGQASLLPTADAVAITREFTAAWYEPSRSGHGLGLEVVDSAAGKTAVMYWFTYEPDGTQLWLHGSGPVVGDSVTVTAYRTRGGSFDGNFQPSNVVVEPWGVLQLSFSSCTNGQLNFTPFAAGSASGIMPLTRLTQLFNGHCTGGLSDDRPSDGSAVELVRFLDPVGAPAGGTAKVKFEQRPDRTEFSIELEDVPAGNYDFRVDGEFKGTIMVTSTAASTRGELEFRSPAEPGKQLLDFDPRGRLLSVSSGASEWFRGSVTSSDAPAPTPPPSGGVPTGSGYYELVVEPSGNDGPELHAELEQRSDRVEFSLELEDVPVGDYQVQVGGVTRGMLTVQSFPDGTEGELEFRNPVEPGKLLLDFDPRGQVLAVFGPNGTSISGVFPLTPSISDGDDSGSTPPPPPAGSSVSTVLQATGMDADASGKAQYESFGNEQEFEVEVEDLDDGSYELRVGGVTRGTVQVAGEEGELRFRFPERDGSLLLDFDPRGKLIEVVRGANVYLRGTL